MSLMRREILIADRAPKAIGPYSLGVRTRGFVFTTGTLGIDPDTSDLIPGGIEAETRQALINLCQIDNKLTAQGRNATWTDLNILFLQFCNYLLFTAMPDIECLANINQNIVAEVGTRRYKIAQLLGTMYTATHAAYQNDLMRIKRAYVQCGDFSRACFLNFHWALTDRKAIQGGSKFNERRFGEQAHRRDSAEELVKIVRKTLYPFKRRFFLLSSHDEERDFLSLEDQYADFWL